jgi:hypothetical protein
MDEATIRALAALNREFYEDASAEFSATRRHPWAGWYQIVDGAIEAPIHYVGIDDSQALLADARKALEGIAKLELHHADVTADRWDERLGAARFDLVVAFGLLHHLPGRATRRALIETLAARLSATGLCALAVWRFADFERFRARIVPWEDLHELRSAAACRIDRAELEPGDHLLRWGPDASRARYCHFLAAEETCELISTASLECVASFAADGRSGDLNHYYLLRKR